MRVDVRETALALDADTRTRAERCLMLALGRFQPIVPWVAVSVGAVPALSGDLPPAYEVAVQVGGARRFLVVESHPDLAAALGRAADRARRCLERDLSRTFLRAAGVGSRGWRAVGAPRRRDGRVAAPGERPRKDDV